jgi:hypothetical protein
MYPRVQQHNVKSVFHGLVHNMCLDKHVQSVLDAVDTQTLRQQIDAASSMTDIAWPGLLAGLSAYLTISLDDETYHLLLNAFRQFTATAGLLELKTPRDAFLTLLCKNAIPPQPTDESARTVFSERHIACLRALVDVCRYLAEFIDVDTWYAIFVTFEHADHLLHGRGGRRTKSKYAPTGSSIRPAPRTSGLSTIPQRLDYDIGQVLGDIQALFEESSKLADEPFQTLICGLRQLAAESGGAPVRSLDQDESVEQNDGTVMRPSVEQTSPISRNMLKASITHEAIPLHSNTGVG